MKILSVRQPWAKLIVTGAKTVENRNWSTDYRGPVAIHAAMTLDLPLADIVSRYGRAFVGDLPRGGIVGVVELTDVIEHNDGPWQYGLVLREPRRVSPCLPCTGRLGLRAVPAELMQQVQAALDYELAGLARRAC